MLSGSASNGSSGSDRAIEWSLDVERDLATEAAPAKCCHPRLPTRFVPRKTFSALPVYRGLRAAAICGHHAAEFRCVSDAYA